MACGRRDGSATLLRPPRTPRAALFTAAFAALLASVSMKTSLALDNGVGATPPLGFSTWNYFLTAVNATLVKQLADAMAATGLRAAGYEYLNIDAGWLLHERAADGSLQPDPAKFPGGMREVSDYVHSKGLKFGLYTDLGDRSCGPGPGSYGHYDDDAKQFAALGVDYLKVDHCGETPTFANELEAWNAMRDALNKTGRPIYLSTCPKSIATAHGPGGATEAPYAGEQIYSPRTNWSSTELAAMGNSVLVEYRNNVDNWYSATEANCTDAGSPCGMITNIDAFVSMAGSRGDWVGPHAWADNDMLQVCNDGHLNGGMTDVEYRASFSVWAVLPSPLILSADIRNARHECLQMVMNAEVLAVNQDALGAAARLVLQTGGPATPDITGQVFAKRLSGTAGAQAVVFFNRGEAPAAMSVTWAQLGIKDGVTAAVRDLWAHKDVGRATGRWSTSVERHGVVMVSITPEHAIGAE